MIKRLLPLLIVFMVMAQGAPSAGAVAAFRHARADNMSATLASIDAGAPRKHTSPHKHATTRKHTSHKHARKSAIPASGLDGVVRRDHKRPLAGATLTCTQGRHSWHTKTDRRGSFHLTLAPGRYLCRAAAHGYTQVTTKTTITAHRMAHVTFTLAVARPRHGKPRATPAPTGPVYSLPTEGPTPYPSGPTGGETCSWISTQAPYVDTNAAYWATAVRADPTVILTIAGVYPAARYVSLQAYNAQGEYISGLADKSFPADPGTANPFTNARASRGTGRYTLHLIFAPAPTRPVAGTLYVPATAGDTVVLVYRVYLPDLSADQKGNAGLPAVTAVSLATGSPSGCPLPDITFPLPVDTATPITSTPALTGTALATPTSTTRTPGATTGTPAPTGTITPTTRGTITPTSTLTTTTPSPFATPTPARTPPPTPAVAGFARLSGDQLGGYANPDAAYLVSSLPPRLGLYVIRFKPPTTPHTLSGGPLDPKAQVRYWSICIYSIIGAYSCTADEQAQLDASGQLTMVLGATWARPPNVSSLRGVIWIDLGAYFILPYKVIIRELLPARGFATSIFAVPLGAAPDAYMGAYAPTLTECSAVQFQANECA